MIRRLLNRNKKAVKKLNARERDFVKFRLDIL